MRSDVSALILAGGRATRLGGIAKHAIVIGGETILARQTRLLAPRVQEILISSPSDIAGYRCVRDAFDAAGPLAGIAAGLAAAATPWLLVVAGDMPYLTGELVDALLAAAHDGVDAVCVRERGLPEPLVSVVHARARDAVETRLAHGRYQASGLFTEEALAVAWHDVADARTLRSINAPEDLRE
ncbi:MAG: molybdenum cofactor guanylyltransferase [Acidobacteriota bacterium]